MPPIFNQDDGQRVKGVRVRADRPDHAALGREPQPAVSRLRARSQNPANDGKRLVLTPELSGSVWTTVRLPRDIRVGGGVRYTDPVFVNAANTIQVPRYAIADALVEAPIARS